MKFHIESKSFFLRLNEQIRKLESEEEVYQKSKKTLEDRCSEFRERAAELQDTVEDLKVNIVELSRIFVCKLCVARYIS